MHTTPLFSALRRALDHLNWNRGRGDVHAIRLSPDGTGTAERRMQYGGETIRFRVHTRENAIQVFALGSSRIESLTKH